MNPAKPVDPTFETPAVHRDAVVIVGNAHFYRCGLLLARQLLEKEQNRTFDICVICSEEIETPAALAEGLGIGRIRFARTDHLRPDEKITAEACVRIYLPGEMCEYRRLCYLDADMENQPVAAVADIMLWGGERKNVELRLIF